MTIIIFNILLLSSTLLSSGSTPMGASNPATRIYQYESHPAVNAYELLPGGAIQHQLTDELEQKYYGVRITFLARDPKTGIGIRKRDTSRVTPGKVTVRLSDGSHIDVDFGGSPIPAAHVVAGSGVDSHGNQLPSRRDQISDGLHGRSYDFSGPGSSRDQHDFGRLVGAFGVKLTGHGKHVRCIPAVKHTVVCHQNQN
ncbi:MAG: hypothetical protein ABI129_09850 [Rhodanobacter sp.]